MSTIHKHLKLMTHIVVVDVVGLAVTVAVPVVMDTARGLRLVAVAVAVTVAVEMCRYEEQSDVGFGLICSADTTLPTSEHCCGVIACSGEALSRRGVSRPRTPSRIVEGCILAS